MSGAVTRRRKVLCAVLLIITLDLAWLASLPGDVPTDEHPPVSIDTAVTWVRVP